MIQYCVLSSQVTSVGYVGNVICLKFVQESFKELFEKELVKNMMYLVWELTHGFQFMRLTLYHLS